jgi:hypothetical protein
MTCIDQPVSWLRLERLAAGAVDREAADHLAACPACARCLAELRADVVLLRPIATPTRRARWWRLAVPAMAFAAAALVLLMVWPRPPGDRDDVVRVKGVGDVIVGVIRERGGAIRDDARSFRPGDRWKVVVTCPPEAAVWIEVDVDGDRPLPPAQIACGNRVALPGAFELTDRTNRICVRAIAAARPAGEPGQACVTISAEP